MLHNRLQANTINESFFSLLFMVSGYSPVHLHRESHYFSNFCTAKCRKTELGIKRVAVRLTDNVLWMPCFAQDLLSCYMEYKSLL